MKPPSINLSIPKWPETLTLDWGAVAIKNQDIAIQAHPEDDPNQPATLFFLNIGTEDITAVTKDAPKTRNITTYARQQFACCAALNLIAVPIDIAIRIAKVVTFYHLFASSKIPLSERCIFWLKDVARILIAGFTWPIVIIAALFATIHPSAAARAVVVTLQNALLNDHTLDNLSPMTLAQVKEFAKVNNIPLETVNKNLQKTLSEAPPLKVPDKPSFFAVESKPATNTLNDKPSENPSPPTTTSAEITSETTAEPAPAVEMPGKYVPWTPRNLSLERANEKMWKNAEKAITEHREKTTAPEVYAPAAHALPPVQARASVIQTTELSLNYDDWCSEQGPRDSMEDRHFVKRGEKGDLIGVFDGHGGTQTVDYVCKAFEERFFTVLEQAQGNVHRAFELLFDAIGKETATMHSGSTAVLCYIDKQTHQIYTATLADSEANIYRTVDEQLKSIPLSCVRNWSSKKDASRAAIASQDPDMVRLYTTAKNSKYIHFNNQLNVSRAFGDADVNNNYPDAPPITYKPKITINQLKKGDILTLVCDGVKDYLTEQAIIEILKHNTTDVAKLIFKAARANMTYPGDNVTAYVIRAS